ncbi:MAG: hypothetical protein JXJ04_03030 [Spirochaetales bacterium]|nr:hypothetical protein [Spirochaetales bacterium]
MPKTIHNLISGGLITNYYCSSRCGHCLYGCSPRWKKVYITPETTEQCLKAILRLGCNSIHIGGGEPLLNPEALKEILPVFRRLGMGIDYIETNSSWYKNREEATTLLGELMNLGVTTLLISISPFHNEFIPFKKVEGVLEACRTVGMGIFPWVEGFLKDLRSFSPEIPHSLKEYESAFGPGYLRSIPGRYWITLRGRALSTYLPYMPAMSTPEIVKVSGNCSAELLDTSHFHMDLFGGYIPGLCSGLRIQAKDLGTELDDAKYPHLALLLTKGIAGLLDYAVKEHGYVPEKHYAGKCHLCFRIRRYLVLEKNVDTADLKPVEFYREV